MKKTMVFVLIIFCSTMAYASDLSENFSEKYQLLVPQGNTSVRSDYLFEQIALGSEFTVKMLDQLNDQNENLNEKFDKVIQKFDILIDQNKQLIRLLNKGDQNNPSN